MCWRGRSDSKSGKKNAALNTVGSNGKKAKSSNKEKELAKKKATKDTAIS